MRGKANFLGHSIHPMLIVLPLGLLSVMWIFDILHFATGNPVWAHTAFWTLTFGLAGGILAAIPGLVDLFAIPSGTRARRVGYTHLGVNLAAVGLFLASWVIRLLVGIPYAGAGAFVLALAGFVVLLVGGWFGGELVERLGVSVHPNAGLDASSSLDEDRLVTRQRPHGLPTLRPTDPHLGPHAV